ncbi:MAG: type II toxin-antitoxin system RelE/ParE family toxin [Bacteroidales bacterium]|nr:type II toxin-antitoxin system RelE/ParE family toxin [Bacteroidales bacterium]
MEKAKTLIWSDSAKRDLKNIYDYYAQFSLSVANKLIDFIIEKTSVLQIPGFEKIGQTDEFNKKFQRIIVGNYKIFYKEIKTGILIVRIFHTLRNPKTLKDI